MSVQIDLWKLVDPIMSTITFSHSNGAQMDEVGGKITLTNVLTFHYTHHLVGTHWNRVISESHNGFSSAHVEKKKVTANKSYSTVGLTPAINIKYVSCHY